MYTLEKLTNAHPALETATKMLPYYKSISVKASSPAYSYYTDGEAAGSVAVIEIVIQNPTPKPFDAKSFYNNLYIFPDGKLLTHFMSAEVSWDVKTPYVDAVKKWLETIA
jgi:hypothetical protein